MKGSKRLAVSEPNQSDSGETVFRNKRIMEGSLFDAHRAEPSQQPTVMLPPLDMKRAESSQQHVRALNTQFASWVQSQLQNHPDELWEDGVRDYLDHASGIMEKFSDVVNWIKANATKGEHLPADAGPSFAGKKISPEVTNKQNNFFAEKTWSTTANTATNFSGKKFSTEVNNRESKNFEEKTGPATASTATNFGGNKFLPPATNIENKTFGEKSGPATASTTNVGGSIFSSAVKNIENKTFGEKTGPTTASTAANFGGNKFLPVATSVENKTFGEKAGPAIASTATNFGRNIFSPAVTSIENKTSGEKAGPTTASTSTNFASSWSPGIFSNSQSSLFTFGNQSSAPSNHGASDDADDENDVEQPSSPSVKKSEEKGVVVVHEVKCKLYVKSSDPADKDAWKEKGMGQLSIKCIEGISKATKESKPTIIVRNEVGKILLNALLYPGIKTYPQKNSLVSVFQTSGNVDGSGGDNDSVVARTFLIRVKTADDRDKLASAIQEYAPVE